jgi:hypothetical protein
MIGTGKMMGCLMHILYIEMNDTMCRRSPRLALSELRVANCDEVVPSLAGTLGREDGYIEFELLLVIIIITGPCCIACRACRACG